MQTLPDISMTSTLRLGIEELIPYINWIYFYHAWGIKEENADDLKSEAEELLRTWSKENRQCLFRIRLLQANSKDDDILLYEDNGRHTTLPLLRQQRPPYLCLADFLPPLGMKPETMGIFTATTPFDVSGLLEQTLADRLAEAAAERGHEIVRKEIWGYAPNESLTPNDLFAERYIGKRPAVGYPSLPDQSINFIIASLLDFSTMGISLSENGAMIPHATTSGLVIRHPQCRHFKIGDIGEDQLLDYAVRRGIAPDLLRKFIDTTSR